MSRFAESLISKSSRYPHVTSPKPLPCKIQRTPQPSSPVGKRRMSLMLRISRSPCHHATISRPSSTLQDRTNPQGSSSSIRSFSSFLTYIPNCCPHYPSLLFFSPHRRISIQAAPAAAGTDSLSISTLGIGAFVPPRSVCRALGFLV